MTDPFFRSAPPSHVPAHLLHDFNIYDYGGRDPFVCFRELYEEDVPSLFWTRNNGGHWVARNSRVIGEITNNSKVFSNSRNAVPDEMNTEPPLFIPLQIDPPRHQSYRSIVAPLLSPSRVAALESRLRSMTDSIIEEIRGRRECEFVADFATQMPVIVFLQLLDLPLSDRAYLLDVTNRVVKPKQGETRAAPMEELFAYLRPIIRHRQAQPGDDTISRLVSTPIDGHALDFDDMVRLSTSILLGGLDSTAATLGFFVRYLADTPAARHALIEEPALIPAAVEEIFRRFSPGTLGRIVHEDVTFDGVRLRKGDHVQWAVAMYNLDDRLFPDPLKVDFKRKRTQHHGFGTGIHFCIGAFLARSEMKIFAEHWLRKIPEFAVKPGSKITYRTGINICYQSIPLVF
jgi:camphor 5-monooxygenase